MKKYRLPTFNKNKIRLIFPSAVVQYYIWLWLDGYDCTFVKLKFCNICPVYKKKMSTGLYDIQLTYI